MGRVIGKDGDIYDEATGLWVGVTDLRGREQLVVLATDVALSGVTYNGSSQVTAFTVGTTAYVVTYPDASTIVVTGGGQVKTIGLDGSGRVSTVTVT